MPKTRSARVRALRFGAVMQRTDAATEPPRRTELEHTQDPADPSGAPRPRRRPARRRGPPPRLQGHTRPQSDRLPRRRHRPLRHPGHRPLVARLDRAPERHPDLPLRRSGPASLVHRLAGVRPRARTQPRVLAMGERPQRRQPALEHVGHPRRRGARPGHLGLGPHHRHQRRAHARPHPERVGLFRRAAPARQVEGRGLPGRARSSATRPPSSRRSSSATSR